ncbi:hypothetical protein [Streptomyces sp. NPDC052701]|uniref:hypothetical protein n=1 Tax=Streptomyces sp. NPDC052701 TaxID=3155533 RepID=UPI00341779E0
MRLADAVAIAGGVVDAETFEDILTPAGAAAAREALSFIRLGTVGRPDGPMSVEVVKANSMRCRGMRVDGGEASVILIPLGALARARALARRFLQHLAHRRRVRVVGNPVDERSGWELLPGLVPVYGEYTGNEKNQWDALKAFNQETEADQDRDTAANDIMSMCLMYLAMHEMVHLGSRHDKLLHLARAGDPLVPRGISLSVLRRGLEINADIMGAITLVKCLIMVAYPPGAKEKGFPIGVSSNGLDAILERFSFAATMLFSLYDTHRGVVFDYDNGSYPHPIVRSEHTHEVTLGTLKRFVPQHFDAARQSVDAGWHAVNEAISELEFAALQGEYGRPADGNIERCIPVTALKYGMPVALMENRIQMELRLGEIIEWLLRRMNESEGLA